MNYKKSLKQFYNYLIGAVIAFVIAVKVDYLFFSDLTKIVSLVCLGIGGWCLGNAMAIGYRIVKDYRQS